MLEWIISASVLIIMVMVSRKLLKGKISCWVQYSLWLLVAVRLLVPVSPLKSALSVVNLLPENWAGQEAGEIPGGNAIGSAYGAEPGQDGISRQEGMSDMAVPAVPQPADDGHSLTEGIHPVEKMDASLLGSDIHGKITESELQTIIEAAWLAGSCLLAFWFLGVNGSFRWRVRRNRMPLTISSDLPRQLQWKSGRSSRDMEFAGRMMHWMRKRGGKRLPIYVTDEISTPCMYGLLRPAIYITSQVAEDPWLLALVLRHEQMHYRHGDHIWAVVRMLCLCIHWYNPLVWAAVSLSRQDGELACDEGVLRQLGEKSRKRYGEALLALSMGHKTTLRGSLNLATSMSDSRKQLKERLSALVKMPRMAAGTAVLVSLLALGLAACTFTSRADIHEEDPATDKTGVLDTERQDSAKTGDMGAANAGVKTESDDEMKTAGFGQSEDSMSGSRENQEEAEEQYRLPWVLAEEYTGYLDEIGLEEVLQSSWQTEYRDQDYDGDGLIDRIYQDVESEPGVMKMRVEFGNGEVLAFDTYQNSPLVVQSMDLDGDGSRELLFTKPNGFSTNPPAIPTDILLFTRQGDGYRQVDTALPGELPEGYHTTPLETYMAVSCNKEDDSHIRVSWIVPGAEGDLGKTQISLRPADEWTMERYEPTLGGWHYAPAYNAELIQERYAFLRLYFEGLDRSGDEIWVDLTLENGELSPVSSIYVVWTDEEMVGLEPEETGAVYDSWEAQTLEYFDEEGHPVAEVTEGEVVTKLTYVETSWSLSALETQFSREILYWACQALQELEEWTGTRLTEVCYSVTKFGDFTFAQTPEDMIHSRTFYSRCYNSLLGSYDVIESVDYSTDMDVWFSPVKQYVAPPRYDRMTVEEILTWYFERSVIARGSRVEEIFQPWEGSYVIQTDQGTYYEFLSADETVTVGRGMHLQGPYDSYPLH